MHLLSFYSLLNECKPTSLRDFDSLLNSGIVWHRAKLTGELSQYGDVIIATEDGSLGTKGNVMDAIKENDVKSDVIYACGPTPMLKAIKTYAIETGTEAWISMEEKMACGIGACLACVCKSKEVDHHTHVNNKRVCKDGPVFNVMEVEL